MNMVFEIYGQSMESRYKEDDTLDSNANTERAQIDVLNNMFLLLEKFDTNLKTANYAGRF